MNTETTSAWMEVPDELRASVSPMRRWGELYGALTNGKTVFVEREEAVRAAAAIRARLAKQHPDLTMHTRTLRYRDRPGMLLWVTE